MTDRRDTDTTVSPGERYWNPEENMYFTVIDLDEMFGTIVQYEDGDIGYHELAADDTFVGDHKQLSTGADGPTLADACQPERHQFDIEPGCSDFERRTATCERCGLAYDAITMLRNEDPDPSAPFRCIECEATFTGETSSVTVEDGRVCEGCWESEYDAASAIRLSELDQYAIRCREPRPTGDESTPVDECGWICRATPETTTRFLGEPGRAETADACPECGNENTLLAPLDRSWARAVAEVRGVSASDGLSADDLFGPDAVQRTLTSGEKEAIEAAREDTGDK